MPTKTQQISVDAMLDVQAIERELNELWAQKAGAGGGDEEGAVLRARVLNLMVYVTGEQDLRAVDEMLVDVAAVHPCRALVMLADEAGEDRDIEMQVSSRCQLESGAGGRHLCCEQVTLRASGSFVVELPSASVPLLVSDLPVFLWWRGAPDFESQIFQSLCRATDRVIIDTAACHEPDDDLRALARFMKLQRKGRPGLSDLNWSRLTAWRALLAGIYDVPEHANALGRLSRVRVEYVAPLAAPDAIAPKALILAGWLASRLDWRVTGQPSQAKANGARLFSLEKDGQAIVIEFQRVSHEAVAPGGLARVELVAESEPRAVFVAMRAEDGRNLETQKTLDAETRTMRVLAGGDMTAALLLAAELEILSHDRLYEEAVAKAVELLDSL
jgi:glucose-6-phosphate dehydrogenase assembly protein OpcA